MGRLAAVASAIAQNPALDGHATVPPPVVSRGAAGVSHATVAALDPALDASAIAQNPALDGHATVPPPVVSRGAAGVSQATVAALDPALAPAMADCMDAGHLRAAAAHAHTAASAETHNEGGAAERDLTDEEVIFKTRMLVKSVAVATCVAGGIMLLNSRLLFGWQRGPRGAYDSDAFQRAFARFLNEKGWERERPHGYDDRSQRAQAFRRENDAFWKEFHAREEQVVHLSVR